jgi:hypothetical protein
MTKRESSGYIQQERGHIKSNGATKGHSKPGSNHTVAGPPPAIVVPKPNGNK